MPGTTIFGARPSAPRKPCDLVRRADQRRRGRRTRRAWPGAAPVSVEAGAMPMAARSASSRLVRTVTPSRAGGAVAAAAASTAASQHRAPAGRMQGQHGHAEPRHLAHRACHGVGDVVQLEVEKDRQPEPRHRLDPARALGREELEPELDAADMRRQRPGERQRALEIGAVDGAEDRVGQGVTGSQGAVARTRAYSRGGSVAAKGRLLARPGLRSPTAAAGWRSGRPRPARARRSRRARR